MSEPGNTSPAEVLRAKRLEIVDDEGKVRAVLGTREEGVGGLWVFDESGRVRARLEAGEIPEQGSGLSVFDTNGKPRAVVNMSNDAAVMIQGYRALKDFIALERQVKETDELAAEIEELKREYGVA
jgi:hypothetical protein